MLEQCDSLRNFLAFISYPALSGISSFNSSRSAILERPVNVDRYGLPELSLIFDLQERIHANSHLNDEYGQEYNGVLKNGH